MSESKTDAISEAQAITGSIESAELVRSYQAHVPVRKTSQALSLLVLRGGHGDGAEMRSFTGMDSSADAASFIVVYPDGMQKKWADGRHMGDSLDMGVNEVVFLSSLVQRLSSELNADPKRIYTTGISNGGFMSARLASDASSVFAAVAATVSENIRANCKPSRAVPFVLIHGTADTFARRGW